MIFEMQRQGIETVADLREKTTKLKGKTELRTDSVCKYKCVSVWGREREKERERKRVCVCVCERVSE